MASTIRRNEPQRLSVGTTMLQLNWVGGKRPQKLSVQAPAAADVYVAVGDGLDAGALPTHYWTVPAGSTHTLDVTGADGSIAIAVSAGTETVTVWAS